LRVLAQDKRRLGRAGRGVGLDAEEAIISLDAVVEAEIRNSSRPGSQAPHAPPALTFGLTGKQKVKSVGTGHDLIRLPSGLPRIRKVPAVDHPQSAELAPQGGLNYLRARFSAIAI
jgi:hypothetical protein